MRWPVWQLSDGSSAKLQGLERIKRAEDFVFCTLFCFGIFLFLTAGHPLKIWPAFLDVD
ncbi:MAG: hypothetical protein ABSC01_07620 [Verrucomicrobiota bacterium]